MFAIVLRTFFSFNAKPISWSMFLLVAVPSLAAAIALVLEAINWLSKPLEALVMAL